MEPPIFVNPPRTVLPTIRDFLFIPYKVFFQWVHFFLDFLSFILYVDCTIDIQSKTERERFSGLRQFLLKLIEEMRGLVQPFLSDLPVVKGTVYELKRKCGKPGCKCAQGELHTRMVLSSSEKGKTRLRVIPRGFLVETQQKVRRYQEIRRARARVVEIHRQMLQVMDEMEVMRREELPSSSRDRDGSGDIRE